MDEAARSAGERGHLERERKLVEVTEVQPQRKRSNHGLGLESAANLGAKIGSEVVQVLGAVIPEEGWGRVRQYHETLKKP